VCASIALAALMSFPAVAELPRHRLAAVFAPLQSECSGSGEFEGDRCLDSRGSFGRAVAIRNGIAFIGNTEAVPTARVAVYGQTASGWVRTATITAPDASSVADFGRDIIFRDGLVLISSAGAVHVFKLNAQGVWTAFQKLAQSSFPGTMRYENGILAIGADNVVNIYERDATGNFVRRNTLHGSSPTSGFGSAVGVAGNVVVVGEPRHNAAYVFKRRTDGSWIGTQQLLTADTPARGDFGSAVAIDRGMIIVGAPSFDCNEAVPGSPYSCPLSDRPEDGYAGGAAFGFVAIAGHYVELFKLRPRPDEHSRYFEFGSRIVMMGGYIAVTSKVVPGGDGRRPDLGAHPGLVFTYTRDGSTVNSRGFGSGNFTAIGLANNWLLLGSSGESIACRDLECAGQAIIFDLNRLAQ
jgi:hypothetical protein